MASVSMFSLPTRKETYCYEVSFHSLGHGVFYKTLCTIGYLTSKELVGSTDFFGFFTAIFDASRVRDFINRLIVEDTFDAEYMLFTDSLYVTIKFVADDPVLSMRLDSEAGTCSLWMPQLSFMFQKLEV